VRAWAGWLLAGAAAALAACDQPAPRTEQRAPIPVPIAAGSVAEPSVARERAGPVRWDAKAGVFEIGGKPLRAEKLWTFDGATDGFSMDNGEIAPAEDTGLSVAERGPDSALRTPIGLNVDGRLRTLVIVRLTRVRAGQVWDGSVHYVTRAHGETSDFLAKSLPAANPQVGETVTLVFDMAALRRGGDDWKRSIIDRVRIDLDDSPDGAFVVRQVAIAQDPGGWVNALQKPPVAQPAAPAPAETP